MSDESNPCCLKDSTCCGPSSQLSQAPAIASNQKPNCCGNAAHTPDRNRQQPGYDLCRYVIDFIDTPAGAVPRVKTVLAAEDYRGMLRVRLGIGRYRYAIAPGLYAVGNPDRDAPVLVTANYKLTFNILRSALKNSDVWILVLDTLGINVWCAAGKGTFSTEEINNRVKSTGLETLVRHRRLILPQLGATGVAAHEVKKESGFEVVWGPVRSADIKSFLLAGMKADSHMRQVTFSFRERLVLIPVEAVLFFKHLVWLCLAAFFLSGISGDIFSIQNAWSRGLALIAACVGGVFAGAVAAPMLLPWLPARPFAVKGALTGACTGVAVVWMLPQAFGGWEILALILCTAVLSSFLAMNFTGATPFTSPSGVEKEMRRAIPLQAAAVLAAVGIWIGAAFAG